MPSISTTTAIYTFTTNATTVATIGISTAPKTTNKNDNDVAIIIGIIPSILVAVQDRDSTKLTSCSWKENNKNKISLQRCYCTMTGVACSPPKPRGRTADFPFIQSWDKPEPILEPALTNNFRRPRTVTLYAGGRLAEAELLYVVCWVGGRSAPLARGRSCIGRRFGST